jgi:hypothetical protein|tara:strand:- start:401 stop:517 length:117 start_codon:yes stop_codon:yes gene_type:complete
MKNLEILKDKFLSLSKKGKMLTIFVGLVVGIIILDWLF